jgi:hypothetical protein
MEWLIYVAEVRNIQYYWGRTYYGVCVRVEVHGRTVRELGMEGSA